jgi:hypothetical protein
MKNKTCLVSSCWHSWNSISLAKDKYLNFKARNTLANKFFTVVLNRYCDVAYNDGVEAYRYSHVINFVGIIKNNDIVSNVFKIFDMDCAHPIYRLDGGKLRAYYYWTKKQNNIKFEWLKENRKLEFEYQTKKHSDFYNIEYQKVEDRVINAMADKDNIKMYLSYLEIIKIVNKD